MRASETSVLRRIALATTVVTGFTGLVYEVTWHKYLSNIVGSEARATAIILAVFLGGLSIGYELFGRLSKGRSPNFNLKVLAYSELAIGVWALMFDQIFGFLGSWSQSLPLSGAPGLIGELLAASFLMLVPTVLMGGTLPLLTQGLNLGLKDAPKFHSKIYACNTGGAFLGCLGAGFYFIPFHGLPLTMFYMAILNLLAGLVLGLVATSASRDDIAKELATSESKKDEFSEDFGAIADSKKEFLSPLTAFVIASLAGFYSIALQTILVRVTGLSLGSSEYAFSIIVSLFIFMLALGASGVSKLNKVGISQLRKNQGLMIVGAGFVFLSMTYWNYINHLVRIAFGKSEIAFYGYFAASFLWMGLILSVVLGTMGRTLPLLFSSCRQDRKDIGGFIGTLYGLNTLGCVAGALIGGYVGLYYLDLDEIFRILMGLMLVTYVLVSFKKSSWLIKGTWAAALVFIILAPQWNKEHMGFGLFRLSGEVRGSYQGVTKLHRDVLGPTEKLFAYKDGPSGTISVFNSQFDSSASGIKDLDQADFDSSKESDLTKNNLTTDPGSSSSSKPSHLSDPAQTSSRSIVVNGKSDGSTHGGDLVTTTLLAHLPALLSLGTTGDTAVIGFGTGITVGNLAVFPHVKSVDVIEISSVVKDFADHFKDFNLNAERNPKVNWMTADAYRVFTSSPKNYDIIVSEPSNPWVTGVERLYTQEFFKIVKGKLAPGGVYAQWFHTYSISDATLGLVMNTYASVFPHIYTFRNHGGDLIILGSETGFTEKNLEVLEDRFFVSEVKQELAKINIMTPATLIGLEVLNSAKAFTDQGLHLLDFPKLSYSAGKDFFKGLNTDVERVSESPINLPFNIMETRNTLFSIFSKKHFSDESSQGKKSLSELCVPTESGALDVHWLKLNRFCKGAFFNAVQEGWLKVGPHPDNVTTAMFEAFDRKSWTISKAKDFLSGYLMVHSDLFPISKEELLAKSEICQKSSSQEAVLCQLNFLNALYVSGYFAEADSFLNEAGGQMSSAIQPQELEKIRIIEKRSKLARSESSVSR